MPKPQILSDPQGPPARQSLPFIRKKIRGSAKESLKACEFRLSLNYGKKRVLLPRGTDGGWRRGTQPLSISPLLQEREKVSRRLLPLRTSWLEPSRRAGTAKVRGELVMRRKMLLSLALGTTLFASACCHPWRCNWFAGRRCCPPAPCNGCGPGPVPGPGPAVIPGPPPPAPPGVGVNYGPRPDVVVTPPVQTQRPVIQYYNGNH